MRLTKIAIVDLGSGNLHSVEKAVRHVAADDCEISVTNQPEIILSASHIILPGVGAFADCMKGLSAVEGLREALQQKVLIKKTPFFGICVGMQMLFERSYEYGVTDGFGWLAGEVVGLEDSRFDAEDLQKNNKIDQQSDSTISEQSNTPRLKIPHMGWNDLIIHQPHALLDGIQKGDHAYFVHSFHCQPKDDIIAITTDYGGQVVAAIAHENIFATQFHPEKSQATGLRLLENFVKQAYAQ